jgi:hypothetical protein
MRIILSNEKMVLRILKFLAKRRKPLMSNLGGLMASNYEYSLVGWMYARV